jgi:hypothetical protein
MLTLLGTSTANMKADKQLLKLKEFTTLDETRSASFNDVRLDNFLAISKDKRLQTKYDIEEMIRVDVLERVGMKILIAETGDLVGDDLKSAALWFEDKGNTKEVNVLKARYKEFKK